MKYILALLPSFPRKRESILGMRQSKMDSRFRALLSGKIFAGRDHWEARRAFSADPRRSDSL